MVERNRGGTARRVLPWAVGVLVVVVLALAGCGAAPAVLQAQAATVTPAATPVADVSGDRTVTVSGSGSVAAAPDVAVITLGVQTDAQTAGAALTENSTTMQAVITALENSGVPSNTIQTQQVSLSPRYGTPTGTTSGGEQQLLGFTATNLVQVTDADISALGDVIDTAVQAGANRVQGISFEVSNPTDLLAQARAAAWDDAMAKAQQLAQLSGVTLGPVITITESSQGPVPVVARAMAEAAVPISPGSQTLEVSVQVTWALLP